MVMLTDPKKPPREIADARLATFRSELLGGRFRWLFTFFAVTSTGSFLWTLSDPTLAIRFPLYGPGGILMWLGGVGTAAWVLLAALNWRNWLRGRRSPR
jgi:hypothetical protein